MKISLFNLYKQNYFIHTKFNKIFKKLLNNQNYILGKETKKFESNLCKAMKAKFSLATSSGTAALELALRAINIKPGDEIITTSFSWLSTAGAVCNVGAKPVFADVCKDTFLLDHNLVEKKISNKTKAIIVVSLFGLSPNFQKFKKIAKKHNIFLIDDAAQSFGSTYRNKGKTSYADIVTTSFYPTKILGGMGDGGAIFTNNKIIFEKTKLIRNHGIKNNESILVGSNFRFDSFKSSLLNLKIKPCIKGIQIRKKIASIYKNKLNKIVKFQKFSEDHVFNYFCILVEKRNLLKKFLEEKGIEVKIYYQKPIHMHSAYKYLKTKKLINTDYLSTRILAIPMHPYSTKKEINYVC